MTQGTGNAIPEKRIIWLPTGGHMGDAIMILSLFAEALRTDPSLRISYVVRRNAGLITGLASKYPQITIVSIPRTLWGSVRAVLPLFAHRAIVIAPPAWDVHPKVVKLLALLFRLRGDTVIGFEDHTRVQPWHIAIDYEKHTERYIDGLRRSFIASRLPTQELGSAPSLSFAMSLPPDFPFISRPYVLVHPFPELATYKTMPLRRWQDLVHWLREAYPAYGIVLTGTDRDRLSIRDVASADDANVFFALNLPAEQLAGMIAQAAAYIGVDTGPTHIAGVLHVPSVVIAQQPIPAWLPTYNPNAILVWSKEECVCRQPSKNCVIVDPEAGTEHRRCVYFVSDGAIHAAISEKLAASGPIRASLPRHTP